MATTPREQLLPLPPRHPIADDQIAPRIDGPSAGGRPLRPRVVSAGLASGVLGAPLVGLVALLAVGAVAGGVLPGLGSMPAQHGLPGSPAGTRAATRQLNAPELAARISASRPARIPLPVGGPTQGLGFPGTGAGFTPAATGLTHSPRHSAPASKPGTSPPTQAPINRPSPTAAQPAPTATPGSTTSTPAQPTPPASTNGSGSQTPSSSTTPTTSTTTPSGGSQTQPTPTTQPGDQSDGDRHGGSQTTTTSSGQTTTTSGS